MKWLSIGLQVTLIVLTLVGIDVVRSWLHRPRDAATERKQGMARWWALRREQLRQLWARPRGRPETRAVAGEASAAATASAAGVTRQERNRTQMSDHERLRPREPGRCFFQRLAHVDEARATERSQLQAQIDHQGRRIAKADAGTIRSG
jgi:hypothetical protein